MDTATLKTKYPWLEERIIFITRTGSQAYGTALPESDEDFRGIAIPPLPYFFGFLEKFEQEVFKTPDMSIFDLRKFLKLAGAGNATMLEMLFTEPEDRAYVHPFAQALIDSREMFITQKAVEGLYDAGISHMSRATNGVGLTQQGRMRFAAFGYDPKTAMHGIRFLRMAKEVITGKGYLIRRPDAEELIQVRAGAWPLEHLLAVGERLVQEIEGLLKETAKLPAECDIQKLDAICVEIVEASFAVEIEMPIMAVGFKTQTMGFERASLLPKRLNDPANEEPKEEQST